MSQLRALRWEFRTAFAVAAVCALMFSLLVASAVRPAQAFAGSDGVACDHSAYLAGPHAAAAQNWIDAQPRGAPAHIGHKCPACCLSAHASSAILPGRVASFARPVAPAARSAGRTHRVRARARAAHHAALQIAHFEHGSQEVAVPVLRAQVVVAVQHLGPGLDAFHDGQELFHLILALTARGRQLGF